MNQTSNDSTYINTISELTYEYMNISYEESLAYATEGLRYADSLGWINHQGMFNNIIGGIYRETDKNQKAVKYYKKAHEISKEMGNKRLEGITSMNVGIAYMYSNSFIEAEKYYNKSLDIYKNTNDTIGEADIYGKLGIMAMEQSRYAKSLEFYYKALSLNEKIDNKPLISENLANIALILSYQGEYQKALEHSEKALQYDIKNNDRQGKAITLTNIGGYLSDLGRQDEAIEKYEEALEIFEELGIKSGIASNYITLGIEMQAKKRYSKALQYFQEALKVSMEMNNIDKMANAYRNLGYLYFNLSKDPFDLDFSIENTDFNQLNDFRNLDIAIEHTQKAIDLFQEIGDIYSLSGTYKNLAEEYTAKGEWKKAYTALEKHHLYNDSVFNEKSVKKLGILEAERRQIEKENEEERQAIVKAEKNAQRNRLQYLGIAGFVAAFGVILLLAGKLNLSVFVARAFVFLAFIFLFEFILVMIDPITDEYSEGIPMIKFSINLALAIVIFPMHQFFEKKVSQRLSKPEDLSIDKVLNSFKGKD
ncbi:MAG: hypothetical protein Kapaf2KO_02580 [Candidatus Kapaibacteriales bacterium]